MSGFDDSIRKALSEEDAEFLRKLEEEPQYPQMVRGLFKGPMGPPNIVLMIFVVPTVAIAIWTAVRFLSADDVQEMFRWFAGASLTFAVLLTFRLWFGLSIQFNRVIRAVKQLELQVAILASRKPE
jgi:uncharacterized membrane protein (DUF106 family)